MVQDTHVSMHDPSETPYLFLWGASKRRHDEERTPSFIRCETHTNSSKHARQSELEEQSRKDKINAIKQSLGAQQAAFPRPNLEREIVVPASYVVSYFYRCGP